MRKKQFPLFQFDGCSVMGIVLIILQSLLMHFRIKFILWCVIIKNARSLLVWDI